MNQLNASHGGPGDGLEGIFPTRTPGLDTASYAMLPAATTMSMTKNMMLSMTITLARFHLHFPFPILVPTPIIIPFLTPAAFLTPDPNNHLAAV